MSPHEVTTLSPFGLIFILIMSIFVFFLPRKFALLPIIITACYISLGQQLLISVFHFSAIRFILLFTWLRLFIRREFPAIKLNKIDKMFICWVVSSIIIAMLRLPTSDTLVNRLGFVYNSIGAYFLFRFYVRDLNDIERLLKALSVFTIPLSIAMIYEYSTGRNLFSILVGGPEIAMLRNGRFRCQGPFSHPILAGTFGATLVPMLLALLFKEKSSKLLTVAGIISATIIMATSYSSGPLLAFIFGIVGLLMWPLRGSMRLIRWGILLTLIALHFLMKAPVWYFMARVSDVIGGGGWHRSYLIDQAITHIGDWWLLGTNYTADWFPYALEIAPNSADITNQFVSEGVTGGLITMILFIILITLCFKTIGLSFKTMTDSSFAERIIIWSLGASLLAHVIAFMSVSYFDQTIFFWFLLLAVISCVCDSIENQNSMRKTAYNKELLLDPYEKVE